MKPKNQFQKTRSRGVSHRVGGFFEQLGSRVFDGTYCPHDEGDFANWSIDAGFEVKASDNNHPFRLKVIQFQNHMKSCLGFPYNHMIYCLFGYPNKSRKRKGSLLARCRDLVSLQLFLAGSKINLHVVDIQILKKYFDSIYEQKEFDLGLDFEPTYRLGHRQLASLSDYSGISAIGLSRNEVEIRNYNILVPIEVGLVKSIAETKVVTVLPPKLSKKINSSLLRNSQLNLNI